MMEIDFVVVIAFADVVAAEVKVAQHHYSHDPLDDSKKMVVAVHVPRRV
jgi:hypothetical protein